MASSVAAGAEVMIVVMIWGEPPPSVMIVVMKVVGADVELDAVYEESQQEFETQLTKHQSPRPPS